MPTSLASKGFPTEFAHPAVGRSTLEASRIAIRWASGVTDAQRTEVLQRLRLEPAALDEERRPALAVNRTDGLWWVRRPGDRAVDGDLLQRITADEAVAWAAPAYRSEASAAVAGGPAAARSGGAAAGSLFTVNPTRLYVRRDVGDARGGVGALVEGARTTSDRATRLPGMVAIHVDDRTAIEVAAELTTGSGEAARAGATAAASAVRLETIPYLSPTCALPACRLPATPFVPSDPLFGSAWGLARMEVPRAWQIQRGLPTVTVAVIDEGVELGHPDLDLHPQSWNASDDTPDGGPTGNHGTASAGIAAARLDNGVGVPGVAGGCRVMAIATATWADVDIAEGLYFAADHGAHVVSMSFGVYPSWGMWDFDLIRDALQYATDQGLVLVAASGNEDGAEARFPGSDIRTLCVGGSNRTDERKRTGDASAEPWWGTSWGPDLDVVAPCLEIPTTDRLGAAGYDVGDYTMFFNGTSSATPHVAGLAALMLSLRPGLDAVTVRRLIESTCDKISPALYTYGNVASKPSGTWNDEVGYGRVNAERALLAACAHGEDADDDCTGCRGCGGCCEEEIPDACHGPRPVPWLTADRCMSFFESRVFTGGFVEERRTVEIRVSYEHQLCLLGRQQGPLLYTTTLLPGETVTLYEFDRFRRTRSQVEQVSVHTSFRQTMSALSQTRRFASAATYTDVLAKTRTESDTSVSAGGGLAGFFGAPSVSTELSVSGETSVASGASTATVSEQFAQNAVTAAQATEAERSLVVSSFEDAEHLQTTQRTLHNANPCYAVTYFVRRVMEVYSASTRVDAIEWRVDGTPWRSVDDLDGAPDAVREALDRVGRSLPKPGERASAERRVTLPTEGALYEPELAHCSSCDPMAEAREHVELELARLQARRACLEAELLALEVDRRRELAARGAAEPLALGAPAPALVPTAALPSARAAVPVAAPADHATPA